MSQKNVRKKQDKTGKLTYTVCPQLFTADIEFWSAKQAENTITL